MWPSTAQEGVLAGGARRADGHWAWAASAASIDVKNAESAGVECVEDAESSQSGELAQPEPDKDSTAEEESLRPA